MAITLDTLKNLSTKMKIALLAVIFVLIAGLYYSLVLQQSIEQMATLKAKLAELQEQVDRQERIAAQKAKYLKEVAALKEALTAALTKLPDKREIQPLFQSVAMSGKSAGMEFMLFEPKPPEKPPPPKPGIKENIKPSDQRADQKPADAKAAKPGDAKTAKPAEPDKFYEEILVTVSVRGRFHDTLSFFEKVASLPRIVNIENILISDGANIKGKGWTVKTDCTIKTYMFLEKGK
jgi:type IV pilus assembly protein PilO